MVENLSFRLRYQRDGLGCRIADDVLQLDDPGMPLQGLQDLDLPLNLALLDRLKGLNDHLLILINSHAGVNL